MRALALIAVAALAASPAKAERVVAAVSNPDVQITSSFEGTTISLFGNIEPEFGGPEKFVEGPFNVIVVVEGPRADQVARLKTNNFGLWTNTAQETFRLFPTFYQVLSSGEPAKIATADLLTANAIAPIDQARASAEPASLGVDVFGNALIRLMTEDGHFGVNDNGISFLSDTSFTAQVTLPSDVANGPFIAHIYVLKDKELVADHAVGFTVRKSGFERFVGDAARQWPLFYGLVCVVLALGTGWLAGVAFKR